MSLPFSNPPAAKGVPFFTPAQYPAASARADAENVPTLYKPLKIRNTTIHNRFAVSPMCTYSALDGVATDFHLVHLGQYALGGSGLIMVEATGVQPRGRITPQCIGIWDDKHIAPLKRIADFIRSQGSVSAIQLAHAGRKGSTMAPWIVRKGGAEESEAGWPNDLWSASAIPWDKEGFGVPKAITEEDIKTLLEDYKSAAKRAVQAGFDIIEVHGAHGYLISQFLSPITNKRTDKYGGSFENRTRLPKEIISAVRSVIPADMPLLFRISATEWMEYTNEPSWTLEDTIRFAKELPALGVDLIDVSSGANHPEQKIPTDDYFYQLDMAAKIRKAVKEDGKELLVGGVGFIRTGEVARDILEGEEPMADLAFVAREYLRNPVLPLTAAKDLGVKVNYPIQYGYAAAPRV